jgi:poly(ribitol-phosphate) beta-N-acetylglucosaminyltransferase
MTATPDVTVIVPVYNTMPYLTDCLTSLVGQSIGPDRVQIIAVDDGSDDGSEKELQRFAELYPGLVTVLHQTNSGGPARPCNRGLDVAVGRYVYFMGADDYLWREALERLVAEADDYGSEVVAGRMVGVNGRYVHQALYATTDHDVALYTSDLPWSMNNAKLFSRELVERLELRFPEDLPVGSDQPFTLEACMHAQRISVLADDTYYFAVTRMDSGNISYRTGPDVKLACATEVMHRAAKLIEAGTQRDAILLRHFSWELAKVLTVGYLELDEATQERLCRGVAELADAYLTDGIRDALAVNRRLVVCLAKAGELDLLRQVVREQAQPTAVPVLVEGERAYVQHAGFRGPHSVDDRCYQILSESVAGRLTESLQVTSLGWNRPRAAGALRAVFRVALIGLAPADAARVRVRAVLSEPPEQSGERHLEPPAVDGVGSQPSLTPAPDGRTTMVHAVIPLAPLLDYGTSAWSVAFCLEVAGRTYELSLPGDTLLPRMIGWHRGHAFRLFSRTTKKGRLQVVVARPSWRRASGYPLRSVLARLRGRERA